TEKVKRSRQRPRYAIRTAGGKFMEVAASRRMSSFDRRRLIVFSPYLWEALPFLLSSALTMPSTKSFRKILKSMKVFYRNSGLICELGNFPGRMDLRKISSF